MSDPKTESSWLSVRFFSQLGQSSEEEAYPSGEPGALMRRQMAQKSWFDKITSWWVGRSFFVKLAAIAGLTLVSGLFGVLIDASLLFSLSTLIISLIVHKLFTSHEENRRQATQISAQESIALVTNLGVIQTHLATTVENLNSNATVLQNQNAVMSEQVTVLEGESQHIQENNTTLAAVVTEIISANGTLLEQERVVTQDLHAVSVCLEDYHQATVELSIAVESRRDDLSNFSTTVQSLEESQRVFSAAANRFTLFVTEQHEEVEVPLERNHENFLSKLQEENDENEQLIRAWTLGSGQH